MLHEVEYLERKSHDPAVVAAIAETRLGPERGRQCRRRQIKAECKAEHSLLRRAIYRISQQSRGS